MRRLLLFAALIAATGLFRRTPGGGSTPGDSDSPSGSNRPLGSGGPAPGGVSSLFGSYQLAIEAAKPRLAIEAAQPRLAITNPSIEQLHAEWMDGDSPIGENPGPGHGDRDNPPDPDVDMGDTNWPPVHGALGPIRTVTLPAGTRIDRYSSDYGLFTSPEGIPFEQRAMHPSLENARYSVFVLNQDLTVQEATIAPWFGAPGMGTQYKLPAPPIELMDGDPPIITRISLEEGS